MGDYDEFHDPVLRRKAVQARLNEAKAAGEWIPHRWHEVEPGVWRSDPAPPRVRPAPRQRERSTGQVVSSALDRLPPAVTQVLLLLALVAMIVLMLWVFSYPCSSEEAADCGMW